MRSPASPANGLLPAIAVVLIALGLIEKGGVLWAMMEAAIVFLRH